MNLAMLKAENVFAGIPGVLDLLYSKTMRRIAEMASLYLDGRCTQISSINPSEMAQDDWVYCVQLSRSTHADGRPISGCFTLETAIVRLNMVGKLNELTYVSPSENSENCLFATRYSITSIPREELSVLVAGVGVAERIRHLHVMTIALNYQLRAIADGIERGVEADVMMKAEHVAPAMYMSCSDDERREHALLPHDADGRLLKPCVLEAPLRKVLRYNREYLRMAHLSPEVAVAPLLSASREGLRVAGPDRHRVVSIDEETKPVCTAIEPSR